MEAAPPAADAFGGGAETGADAVPGGGNEGLAEPLVAGAAGGGALVFVGSSLVVDSGSALMGRGLGLGGGGLTDERCGRDFRLRGYGFGDWRRGFGG